jgi:hypothetical protein
MGLTSVVCDVSLMNQLCLGPVSESGCHQARITAWWELLAHELAEEWCGVDSEGGDTLSQETGNSGLWHQNV